MSFPLETNWSNHGPSLRWDVACLAAALFFHASLFWMKFDFHSGSYPSPRPRLISIDLIYQEIQKPPTPIKIAKEPRTPLSLSPLQPKLEIINRPPPKLAVALKNPITSIAPNPGKERPMNKIHPLIKSKKEKFEVSPIQGFRSLKNKPKLFISKLPTVLSGGASQPSKRLEPAQIQKRSKFAIVGQLKDRMIEKEVLPIYPAWAQTKGIEATIILEFTVLPDGSVKEAIVVRQTTGYPRLDETAIRALREWKFVPLPDGENREEVGFITIKYSLK